MRHERGFTLLEVMIAMSILVVGATSILGIFVAAVSFHTKRVESNRMTALSNFATQHAQVAFDSFDPSKVKEGGPRLPKPIKADFTDFAAALAHTDELIQEGAVKFPGFRYEIRFDMNPFAVPGSSVVAHIKIYSLSEREEDAVFIKEFLTRRGTPVEEYFKSPSKAAQKRRKGK